MASTPTFQQFWRVKKESSWNAATPAGGAEWNIGGNGGGANGWMDLPVIRESDGLQPKSAVMFPSVASGERAMNAALPIAGADDPTLGNLEFAVYPELIDRFLQAVMGTVARTETAGIAAKSSVAFASLATLDTQPNGTEQLKFTISASTAASGAAINIIQSGVTQETITIGTSGSSVNGVYYSKGGYDGSVNAITFTVTGTVTSGTVVVAGIDKVTNVYTQGDTNPSLVIAQTGRPEAGSGNAEFYPGCVIPTLVFNYDRTAPDNTLMGNATIHGVRPTTTTAPTYSQDASKFYKPIAGWHGAFNVDTVADAVSFHSASITLQPNTTLLAASSGNQKPTEKIEGEFEVFGELGIYPQNDTFWSAFRNVTVKDVEIIFTTPYYIVDTTGYQVKFEFSQMAFGDYTRTRQGMARGATLPFRAIYNTTDSGSTKITTVCRLPV